LLNQKAQMQSLNKRLEEYINDTKSIDNDIARLMKENQELRNRLRPDVNYQFDDLQDRYKEQFAALRTEIHKLSEDCNRLEHEKQNCKTDTELIEQKTKSLEIEKDILQRSIDQAQNESDKASEEHEVLVREISRLREEIEREEKKYQFEKAQLQRRLNTDDAVSDHFDDPSMPEASGQIIDQIKDARREIEQATNRFHEEELEKLTQQIKIYRKDIIEKEQKQRKLDREIDELENQKHMLEAEVQALNSKIKALEHSIDDMKLHHNGKIHNLQEKMDAEQEALEEARRELEKIQRQLEIHLNDKQSLHEELEEMKRLLGIQDDDDASSIVSSFSREASVRSVATSILSSHKSSRRSSKHHSRQPSNVSNFSRERSIRSSMKSVQREAVQRTEAEPEPTQPKIVVPLDNNSLSSATKGPAPKPPSAAIKRTPSKRISFTKHQNGGPTIIENRNWNSKQALTDLKKALKMNPAKGGDVAVGTILLGMTTAQRHIIEREFEADGKRRLRDLFQDKKRKKSSKGFNKAMQLVLASESERDALAINQAMLNNKYHDVVEVLATRHATHIRHVKAVYLKLYGKAMKPVMDAAFKDANLLRFLNALLEVQRNGNNVVDTDLVEKDKLLLKQAEMEHTWSQDQMMIDVTTMLSQRSFGHLWYLLKQAFKDDEYNSWLAAIKEQAEQQNTATQYTSAVFTFLRFIHDLPATAFADSLYLALRAKPEADEDKVLYILISRQEYDLKDIKLCYREKDQTSVNLEADLKLLKTRTFDSPELLQLMAKDYFQT